MVLYLLFAKTQVYGQTNNGGVLLYEINGHGVIAAKYDLANSLGYWQSYNACNDLIKDGFDDWRLPTKDELILLYDKRYEIGGFSNRSVYWSITQDGYPNNAFYIDFHDGEKDFGRFDYGVSRVRCVRSF